MRQSNQRVTLQIPLQTTDNYETTNLIILEKQEQQQNPTGKPRRILMVHGTKPKFVLVVAIGFGYFELRSFK